MGGWMDGGWVDEWMDGWCVDRWIDGWVSKYSGIWVVDCGWMDGWVDACMNGWVGRYVDEMVYVCR